MAIIDLDKFKHINDTWGHQAGDRVLQHSAKEVARRLRKQDFIGRYGGEEFVLLLPDTDLAAAHALTDSLRAHIADYRFRYDETRVPVTFSAGVATLTSAADAEAVFGRADKALYEAKSSGRNRVATSPA